MSVRGKFEIPEILTGIYKDMEVSPVGILKNYALSLIHNKLSKYEAENKFFEKKYSCSFEDFKNKIEAMEEEENFEWDDDFLDWKFAAENLICWKEKLQEVNSL